MGLESGTFLNELVITNPVGASDNVDKGDDHLRLIKKLLKNSFPDVDQAVSTIIFNTLEPSLKRKGTLWGDETADLLKLRNKGNSAFITLAISMLTDNSVDVNTGTIDGATIGAADPSTGVFTTLFATDLSATNMDSTPIGQTTPAVGKVTTLEVTLTSLLTGKVDARETIDEAKGANIASASSTDIWTPATGNLLHITGTTNINNFGTALKAGLERTLIFDSALTLVDGALLDCPGGGNLEIVAGDVVIVRADTTTITKIINHFPNAVIFVTKGPEEFLADGTYNVPAGITKVHVEAFGPGGGAGGGATGNTFDGGGGGAGAYIEAVVAVTGGGSETITIGPAGIGGAAGVDGGNGSDSTFGTKVTAGGGLGGKKGLSGSSQGAGGAGGTGSTTGTLLCQGSDNGASGPNGTGGPHKLSGTKGGTFGADDVAGGDAVELSTGGGGGGGNGGGGGAAGGNGAKGYIIVTPMS